MNYKRSYRKFSFVILSLMSATLLHAQSKVDLRFNPENGSSYIIHTNSNSTVSQMGMDVKMAVSNDLSAKIAAQGPNKEMKLQYANIDVNMDAMGQKIQANSNGTDKNSQVLQKITDKSFVGVLDAKGHIVKINGLDSIVDSFGKDNPVANYFNEDAIRSMFDNYFSFYPAQSIAVGDSWSDSITIVDKIKMKAIITYTLVKIENGLAFIHSSGNLTSPEKQKISINGMEVNISLHGTQTGELTVDNKTGVFQTNHTIQDLSGNIYLMGQEIPMTVKTDITADSKKQ